jgi:hypothetical protein
MEELPTSSFFGKAMQTEVSSAFRKGSFFTTTLAVTALSSNLPCPLPSVSMRLKVLL